MTIDTERVSERYRAAAIRHDRRELLMTDFRGTQQEQDLQEPPNCQGLGRIRHFHRRGVPGWPENPLPIDPVTAVLKLPRSDELRGQVFQNAVCNWRCWYCFVPFELLAASREHSKWVTPEQLVDLYLAEPDRPRVIDLTGGQPDLVPEWIPWMMEALQDRGLADSVYLWSDDNLSNDYFWRYLTAPQRERIYGYTNYAKVCCLKGYDAESFAFNTKAASELFDRQFELLARHLASPLDLYAYVTLTGPEVTDMDDRIARFVDRIQELDEQLPLRTVPLCIEIFTPVQSRLHERENQALRNQWRALEVWQRELERRYDARLLSLPIHEVPLRGRQRPDSIHKDH